MRAKNNFFQQGSFVVGDGMSTRFREDSWLGDTPLASQYPNIFNIVQTKEVTVFEVLSQAPWNIRFNRTLVGDKCDS
jgi:hypothetical protein